ncbi:two-component system copper resistance phosphate regulon response regulator CusR [Labrys monachus]|uniref:Cell cycle response regulator CtrA n=1 Tax=Labrys monachus TaxID=217067 RepID=A0ABU0FDP7_9HYPH|nr:two-component system copper resistance phosphate regulon response regulator CusR [Labrys monachus]
MAATLVNNLKSEGLGVDVAENGAKGILMATNYAYDLVILDITLPEPNGTQILKQIRQDDCETPVIMLTARSSVQDKVTHFESGADDYLTKPFAFMELLVRVRALLRRRSAQQTDVIHIADFELDRVTHRAKRADRRIELSGKEYALLEYLAANAGRVLSRAMILEHVWDQSFESLTNIVEVYIRQLRNKIDEGYPHKLIRTVRGAGYIFGDSST